MLKLQFTFNGFADVVFRCPPRGLGGRAFVHDSDNRLTLNYAGDFTGGTSIGPRFFVGNEGNFRSSSWQPFGSIESDFYVDVEPGTRLLRTRNWNVESPNIGATGIHTGIGKFEGNVKIFGKNEAWSEGISIVRASGWAGLRLTRNDPSTANF